MTPFQLKKKTFVLLLLITLSLFIVPVWADLILPAITHVYFEKDGAPYNGSVQYTVKCYGYFMGSASPVTPSPGSYRPELVFLYTATCPTYGCEIYQPYYMYGHSDWCDLEGQIDNEWFAIRNFSSNPYSRCDFVRDRVSKTWGNKTEYYYYSPEFQACREFQDDFYHELNINQFWLSTTPPVNHTNVLVLQGRSLYEVPPWNRRTINKSAISMDLDQYIGYLESCLPETDVNCPGWTLDKKPLKFFTGYRTMKKNVTEIRQHPCNTFLIEADPSLIMPFTETFLWKHPCAGDYSACNYTYEFCESRFTIPSLNKTTEPEFHHSPEKTVPWTIMDRPYPAVDITSRANDSPAPHTSARGVSHISRSPAESLYCSIVELFGGRCE